MRRFLTVCVAATTALLAGFAWAGNQEVADHIATNLRDSGQLTDYRIGIKYQDGTAWVQGRVGSEDQKNRALKLVFQTQGVTRVVNDLTVGPSEKATSATTPAKSGSPKAQRVPSSFMPTPAQRAAMMQAAPVLPKPVPAGPVPGPAPVPGGPEALPAGAVPVTGAPLPMVTPGVGGAQAPTRFDQANMPNYAWPSYASYPNYAAVTYPKQYSPTAWPYIGPFYPYPQVPLGWRKVTLEWDSGWWFLDFKDEPCCKWWR